MTHRPGTEPLDAAAARQVELSIGGMTCASCAARIERKLNKLDGVTASVNYATEKAKVSFGEAVTPEDLIAVVEHTGYSATLPAPPSEAGTGAGSSDETGQDSRDDEAAGWWQRQSAGSRSLTSPSRTEGSSHIEGYSPYHR